MNYTSTPRSTRFTSFTCVAFLFLLSAFTSNAQDEEIGVKALHVWESIEQAYTDFENGKPPAGNAISALKNKGFFNETPWPWTCVGPNYQPTEMNPGGKAIPSYSEGRGNGTGRINFLLVNPANNDNVFACSPTGGLFVTWDGGESWENTGTDHLPIAGVSSITINPLDRDSWIIATGDCDDNFMFSDGIWRTDDAGKTWVNINGKKIGETFPVSEENTEWTFVGKVAAHPCDFNRVFVATNKGLFMTNNALDEAEKVTWRLIHSGMFYDIEIVPWAESVVFAGGDDFIWSKNCGNDWEALPKPTIENPETYKSMKLSLELTEKDPDVLYVAVTSSEKYGSGSQGPASFQKFNYRTKTWHYVRSLKKSMNNVIPTRARAFAVSPKDTSIVLCGNIQPVYRSVDGGRNFDRVERGQMHDDIHHIEFDVDGKAVWAAHDGGVSVSYDQGLTWQARDSGIGAANVFGVSVAQSEELRLVFGAYDTGGNMLLDDHWYHVSWGDGFQTIIDPNDPDNMFATKQNGHINRSSNGGYDWDKSVTCGLTQTEWHSWIRMHPLYSNIIYSSGNELVRSTNSGDDWEVILDLKQHGSDLSTCYRFWLSPENPSVMYVYVLGDPKHVPVIFRTFNVLAEKPALIKWERIDLPAEGWLGGLAIDPDDPEKFWLAYKGYKDEGKVYRWTSSKWLDIGKGLGYAVVESMIIQSDSDERLYLGTNYGIFTRNKFEDEWKLLTGLPGTYIKSLDINYVTRQLVVGTNGRGIWLGDLYGLED